MGENGKKARYQKGQKLGEGTFGDVTKATDVETGRELALKKVRIARVKEGVNMTALREMKLMKELRHENLAELYDVYMNKRNLILAFEYLPSDLEQVIRDTQHTALPPARVKSFLAMTLRALGFIHDRYVCHRDVKPNNLLLARDGTLKLADFGLAREVGSPDDRMTCQVFARWYRAPELLLGCRHYTFGVDMWAVGCILAEMLQRRPWLTSLSDLEQLEVIFERRGTPDVSNWPRARLLPNFFEQRRTEPKDLRALFPQAPGDALSLLDSLTQLDPLKRPTAQSALSHHFLTDPPLPEPKRSLPVPGLTDRKVETTPAKKDNEEGNDERVAKAPRLSVAMDASGSRPANNDADVGQVAEATPASVTMQTAIRDERQAGTAGTTGQDKPASEASPPGLSNVDRAYLRKRKLDMDEALAQASQQDPWDSPAT